MYLTYNSIIKTIERLRNPMEILRNHTVTKKLAELHNQSPLVTSAGNKSLPGQIWDY